ncbi:hypothetical protein GCM10007907_39190 [Chitinimonas prasina]|uniref:Uncharacterized protein n=1 Tax=Chitinimonas prasina TaxID=1434937 RepID=A0ABQ5YKJ4_9NEIS|nr:hypothetical protein [Chitinimonas prasina]GLR15129.1 hypothetical protein GCM10007907_39190 [Chitinimonas prasina]
MSWKTGMMVVAGMLLVQAAHAKDVKVDLGSKERVIRLFAYPNNCNVICYRNWTLQQTVEHYLGQSLQRDGYTDAKVKATISKGRVHATFRGVPQGYDKPLKALLKTGDLAYTGASKANADGKWAYNWYFFLPLGMALENRKSVELLHFPPDYSLTRAQDYLESATTDRWASLLETNGVAKNATPGYQTIIDIAPIAAPASAGSTLENIYGYFTDYQAGMVAQLTAPGSAGGPSKPMVAFGGPVRDWIKSQYGVSLSVLGLGSITAAPGQSVSVLGSNHPSYIWYAADPANYGGDQAKADAMGLKVMGQDITAACWQATMGGQPTSDPTATLNTCTHKWQVTDKVQTCELFYTSIRNLTPQQAQAKCQA